MILLPIILIYGWVLAPVFGAVLVTISGIGLFITLVDNLTK